MRTSWRNTGLKVRIMAGVIALIAVFGVAVMGNIHHGLKELLKGEFTRRGLAIADILARSGEPFVMTDNLYALHALAVETQRCYDDIRYVYVKDAHGRVLTHTFPGGFPAGLAEVHAAAARGGVRLVQTEDGRIQDIARPLLGGRLGSVHVGMREDAVRGRLIHVLLGWGGTAAALLALGACTAYVLTSRLARRVTRLIDAAEKVGRGDLETRARDTDGDELGRLASAFNEMTAALKLSRVQLLRSGKLAAIGELASSVAHEINNPLNTMAVCCQALLDRSKSPALREKEEFADFPEYLATINGEIFRCKKITTDLLGFARHREPVWGLVDIDKVVAETLALLGPRVQQARCTVELRLAGSLPPLRADADQLKQVLLNLLLNAFDHLGEGGKVFVETAARGGGVAVGVADTGSGILPEHLPRLFEPFFTTKPHGEGTGLGLAVCSRIVDAHQGTIEAANRPEGGAVFTVVLPCEPAPAAGGEAAAGSSRGEGRA
ncbi:MAG: HAMP domain-containing protein [Elusimicrobia bacterium]|nr:HAMP domain-containing protein [Elusimicrobiota bacterium]